jgi:hypothetical protein
MADKDAYWFRHDSNASRGLRLLQLKQIHGFWGLGVYWSVVEILREQEDYRYANDDNSLQLLCALIGCQDEAKFLSFYSDCMRIKLFQEQKGYFLSEGLTKSMAKWTTAKRNGSQGGRPQKKPNGNPTHNLQVIGCENPNHNPEESILDKKREDKIFNEGENLDGLVKRKVEEWCQPSMWLDGILGSSRLKAPQLPPWIKKFLCTQAVDGRLHRPDHELRKHFHYWLNTQNLQETPEDRDPSKPDKIRGNFIIGKL